MDDRTTLLEGAYFDWLVGQVSSRSNPNPARSWVILLEQLHTTPFDWFIPNDDNRIEDGCELRSEFINGPFESDGRCSVLEMLIALSRRASFESYSTPAEWFWHLMSNLDLAKYTDEVYMDLDSNEVDHILHRMINRRYDYDGLGGLFPLREPTQDQRQVELWYQMSSYLLEGQGP